MDGLPFVRRSSSSETRNSPSAFTTWSKVAFPWTISVHAMRAMEVKGENGTRTRYRVRDLLLLL